MKLGKQYISYIIRENINKLLLNEFMQSGFDMSKLDSMNVDDLYDYCMTYLGNPIGEPGSSRVVFEIDDSQVIKLAYGDKASAGMAQNQVEWELSRRVQSPLLVKTLYHSKDWKWIICERVLPCKEIDFYKVLGLPYLPYGSESSDEDMYEFNHPNLLGYRDYKADKVDNSFAFIDLKKVIEKILKGDRDVFQKHRAECEIIQKHPWFRELYRLCNDCGLNIIDVCLLNMGLTMRGGKPTIVILDSGLNKDIWNKYYQD